VRSRRIIHIELGQGRRKRVDQVITRVLGVWCQWGNGGSTQPARERRLFHGQGSLHTPAVCNLPIGDDERRVPA
jgi:hypothetical protein